MLNQLTISELNARLASGKFAREATQACLDQSRAWTEKFTPSYSHERRDAWLKPHGGQGTRPRIGRTAKCLLGCRSHQGRARRQKPAVELRLEDSRQIHSLTTRTAIEKLKGGGRNQSWRLNMDDLRWAVPRRIPALRRHAQSWDTARIPGVPPASAAAVRRMNASSLGTDNRRVPSAAGGVVPLCRLETTYGTHLAYGLVAVRRSLDQIGPVSRRRAAISQRCWAF